MRVLHLSWEYPPVMYGGLGRHVHALAETQAARGDEVVVITQSDTGQPRDDVVNGVRVIRVRRDAPDVPEWRTRFIEWTFGFNVAVARAGIALERQWRPDVVHGHDWLVGQAAVLVCEAANLPFVLTMHATEAGRMGGELVSDQSRAIHSTERWTVGLADAVIVCSDHMRREIADLFGTDAPSITVIPNGIDPDDWTASESQRQDMRSRYGTPLVVFAGRLETEKGAQTLVDALPQLRDRVPGIKAVIIGTGGAEGDLRDLVRRGHLEDAVSFAGYVTDEDLRSTVAAADVAVVPSLYEPFGFVALEATALGAPLAVARTGGLAEIVEADRTGWLFTPGDSSSLADTVADMLAHPQESASRAAAGRASLEERFGWPMIVGRTEAVYRAAASR